MKTLEMRDLYNNEDLRFIYNYMSVNKDLSDRLKKELNMSDRYSRAEKDIESCVKEYKESGCISITEFASKHRPSHYWIKKNNKMDEFKKLVGVEIYRKKSHGNMDEYVNEYMEDNCKCISDFKRMRCGSYNWILKHNKMDEFKKLAGIEDTRKKEFKISG